MTFKLGDTVIITEVETGDSDAGYSLGMISKVVEEHPCGGAYLEHNPNRYMATWQLELVEQGEINKNNGSKIMSTLTNIYRSLKLGEPLKTFVETGIKNKDNTLTSEGTDLLMEILAEKHEPELKEAADKIKEEQKKED